MKRQVKRGDIYYADLSPTRGSEQGGVRPVLILQNDTGNRYSPTVITAPITSKIFEKAELPTHCLVDTGVLDKPSLVLLEQIRTIDKVRLKEFQGVLSAKEMAGIDQALAISLGLK
ncbi:type II toxin-antitoxin system PemK/MazF family toxin [Lachnospiraceae bacterium ZAX-1]